MSCAFHRIKRFRSSPSFATAAVQHKGFASASDKMKPCFAETIIAYSRLGRSRGDFAMETQQIKRKAQLSPIEMGIQKLYKSCYGMFLVALYANRTMRLDDKLRIHKVFEARFNELTALAQKEPSAVGKAVLSEADVDSLKQECELQDAIRDFSLTSEHNWD